MDFLEFLFAPQTTPRDFNNSKIIFIIFTGEGVSTECLTLSGWKLIKVSSLKEAEVKVQEREICGEATNLLVPISTALNLLVVLSGLLSALTKELWSRLISYFLCPQLQNQPFLSEGALVTFSENQYLGAQCAHSYWGIISSNLNGQSQEIWRRKWQPLQYSCLGNLMDRGA